MTEKSQPALQAAVLIRSLAGALGDGDVFSVLGHLARTFFLPAGEGASEEAPSAEAKRDFLRRLSAESGGALVLEPVAGTRTLRLRGRAETAGVSWLLVFDLLGDGDRPSTEALLIRDLPLFSLRSRGSQRRAGERPALLIETHSAYDNIMAGLSLEDAAALARVPFTTRDDAPKRSAESPFGEAGTVPGTASHLSAEAGSDAEAGRILADVLVKGIDILGRRMDIARARVAEGRILERRLLSF